MDGRTGRGRTGDAGEGPVSYVAVVLLVAMVAGALTVSGAPAGVTDRVQGAVCRVGGGADCAGPSEPMQGQPKPPSEGEWGGRTTDPERPPPPPTEAERERGREAAGTVRSAIGADCAWYKPWTWGCDEPEPPRNVLGDMSPGEINALFDELDDGEIRRLLGQDGVVDVLMVRADVSLLHRLEGISPGSFEPDFRNVRNSQGDKPEKPATGWGTVKGVPLYRQNAPDDLPALGDLSQGELGNCWWLAGMGALASTGKGAQTIKDMIRQNPNGTYTVTFTDAEKVTVTPYFPINADGGLVYSEPGDQYPAMWPMVLEKALAAKRGGYEDIVGGYGGEAMELLTGEPSESQKPAEVSLEELAALVDEGVPVTAHTHDDNGKAIFEGADARLVGNHVYVVRDVLGDTVSLYNPWGRFHAMVSLEEFHRYFEGVETNRGAR